MKAPLVFGSNVLQHSFAMKAFLVYSSCGALLSVQPFCCVVCLNYPWTNSTIIHYYLGVIIKS